MKVTFKLGIITAAIFIMAGCNQKIVPGSSPNASMENMKEQGEELFDSVKGDIEQEIYDFEMDTEDWINEQANSFFTEETSTTERVDYVVDGDTVKLANGDSVRFLSIDTPESTGEYENDPMPYGEEASACVKQHIEEGSLITIVFDGEKRDKYDRLLGYIELPDGRDLNKMLLEKGYAEVVYVYDDYERLEEYREAEEQAKQQDKGIWKNR